MRRSYSEHRRQILAAFTDGIRDSSLHSLIRGSWSLVRAKTNSEYMAELSTAYEDPRSDNLAVP